jgi:hypothetical protein
LKGRLAIPLSHISPQIRCNTNVANRSEPTSEWSHLHTFYAYNKHKPESGFYIHKAVSHRLEELRRHAIGGFKQPNMCLAVLNAVDSVLMCLEICPRRRRSALELARRLYSVPSPLDTPTRLAMKK